MAPFLKDLGVGGPNGSQLCEKFHNDFSVIGQMSHATTIQRSSNK